MEPHPIPRQITTFEFKLIGFLTLRQFIYLCIFFSSAIVIFYLVPIPLLNLLLAFTSAALGAALAFVSYNERPLDVWIKNLIKRLSSPSQYYYKKKNSPPSFLKDVFIYSSPSIVESHIIANQKLSSYLSKQKPENQENPKKSQIHQLIVSPSAIALKKTSTTQKQTSSFQQKNQALTTNFSTKTPFLFGVVKNNNNLPLPNVLVYVKNKNGQNIRILKTNHHGVFATFHPLPPGSYLFEIKDLGGKFFFDTMEINVLEKNNQPIIFISKESL